MALSFRYLSEPDMIKAGVKDMHKCIETCEETYKLLGEGDYLMGGNLHNSHGLLLSFPDEPKFPNMPKNGPDRRFYAMPAYVGGPFHMVGIKWYGSNIANREKNLPRSIHMFTLNDPETGAPVAYMSANLISAMRTGAVPGVAIKYLAKKDTKVVSIVGPGVINKTTLMACMDARPSIDTVKIKGRGRKNIDSFVEFVKTNYPQVKNIIVCDTMDEALEDADIVNQGTSGADPEVNSKALKDGVLFIGSARFAMDDDFLLNRCQLVSDNWGVYLSNLEEKGGKFPENGFRHTDGGGNRLLGMYFLDYVHEGLKTKDDIWDMWDVVSGKYKRTSEDQSFAVACYGMPVWDVAWGTAVYRNAIANGIGTDLKVWDEPDMF